MKLNLMNTLMALGVGLSLPTTSLAETIIAPGKYNIDGMHSKIGFEIPHLVISSVEGKFDQYSGTILVDKKIENSKVDVSIDVATINTGVVKRDDHLKSGDFFDVAKFPKITFISKKVTQTSDGLEIAGVLTIRNVSKNATLKVSFLGQVKDGYGQDKIAFKAKTKINRKAYGLSWSSMVEAGPVVGDEVEINLNIQAALSK